MTDRRGLVAGIGLATAQASEGGVTALQAIGSSYLFIIVVRGSCKLVISRIITSRALYVRIPTDCSAGGCFCLVGYLVMTESSDFFSLFVTASGASQGLRACRLTSRSFSNVFLIAVRKSVYGVSSTVKLVATY